MPDAVPEFRQLNLVVRDMDAALCVLPDRDRGYTPEV
jgi:hypothetical protein